MKANLTKALSYILNDEGGFVVRDNEPGGACNKGISFLVFKEWRKKQGKSEPTLDDLRNLSTQEAMEIYTVLYATPLGLDKLPTGMDYAMLNTAVMQGVNGSLRLLTEAQGEALMVLLLQCQKKMYDPNCGPFVPGCPIVPGQKVSVLIERLKKLDPNTECYRGFGQGWSNRIIRVARRTLALMKGR